MSIYDVSSLGTSTNLVSFNGTNFPIFRVVSRRPQQRNVRELDINVPFENGMSDFETLIGRSAYVIEGIMYPGSESNYDVGLRQLRKLANLELSQDDILSDDGYVPYTYTEFISDKVIFMKVIYVDVPENTRKGLVQPFRLVCKIKDPTIYGDTVKQANTTAASFSVATGTALYSFAYPIIFGASTSSVSVDANNAGDIPTYPIGISIFGPVNSPKITNTTTGEYIQVNVNLGSSSNNLVIQYDKDSLSVELDGVSVLNQVTTASTYFKIHPGSNIFSLTGSSISTGAYAIVSFRDAYGL